VSEHPIFYREEPRTLLIDGPVSIYLYDATEEELLAAFTRLTSQVRVAARQIGEAHGTGR